MIYKPDEELIKLALEFEELTQGNKIIDLPMPDKHPPTRTIVPTDEELLEVYNYIVQRYVASGYIPPLKELMLKFAISNKKALRIISSLVFKGMLGKTPMGYLSITGDAKQVKANEILKGVTEEFLVEIAGLSGAAANTVRSLIDFAAKSKWVIKGG